MKLSDKQEIFQRFDDMTSVINAFAQNVQDQFVAMDTKFESRFVEMDKKFETRFFEMDKKFDFRFDAAEVRMVTKDYLDDKIADRSGEFIALLKKEGIRNEALHYMLASKKILTPVEQKELAALSAFIR